MDLMPNIGTFKHTLHMSQSIIVPHSVDKVNLLCKHINADAFTMKNTLDNRSVRSDETDRMILDAIEFKNQQDVCFGIVILSHEPSVAMNEVRPGGHRK